VPRGSPPAISIARQGGANQESAPEEAARRIQEALLEVGNFTIVEEWTEPDKHGTQTMTLSYNGSNGKENGLHDALLIMLKTGFEEVKSDKPYKRRTSKQVYLTAGWHSQVSLHKTGGRSWMEVDFFDAFPRTLLSGRDLGPWGTLKRQGLLFWKEDSDAR
jgi:hypothetical protein